MFKFNLHFQGVLSPMGRSARLFLHAYIFTALVMLLVLLTGPAYPADDDSPGAKPAWLPQVLGLQFTGNYQNTPGFHSPYTGQNSFVFDHSFKQEVTDTYGVYLGSQITRSLQAYMDLEMLRGEGLSAGYGLGAYTNADVIRSGPADLGHGPYLARLYARYVIPLSEELGESLTRNMDRLPGREPVDRIEIKGGKLSPTDDFDQNRYANNGRTQFLNYAFLFNTAWDYASDTRGYTIGASVAFVHPTWRLIMGSYQVPTTRNGMDLDDEIYHARGDNVELDLARVSLARSSVSSPSTMKDAWATTGRPWPSAAPPAPCRARWPTSSRDTPSTASASTSSSPSRTTGRRVFSRGSAGPTAPTRRGPMRRWTGTRGRGPGGGRNWGRTKDGFGMAVAVEGLSGSHRHYLEEGGIGMVIGDGALNYGLEQIFEAYYRIQLGRYVQLSPDFQYIREPRVQPRQGTCRRSTACGCT